MPPGPMLWAAAGGLVTEFISLGLIWKQSRSDLNVRGALWHIIQTFVGSLLIIVTALVIRFTGFLLIDPILGMAFGFVLLWASWCILREAMHLLMEGTPADVSLGGGTFENWKNWMESPTPIMFTPGRSPAADYVVLRSLCARATARTHRWCSNPPTTC
ncbi:MAG: cation transporter [Woeseiaceae bacterium]|nr:cation transporter [Woeseiaceae bacterium]